MRERLVIQLVIVPHSLPNQQKKIKTYLKFVSNKKKNNFYIRILLA
jgi:hypothetical protein